MNTEKGIEPVADWMGKYPANDCGCSCGDHFPPCPPHYPGDGCLGEDDVDSDTLYNHMQSAVAELERIIKPLDLPESTKFQIIHLATCNIRSCMNLLKLIIKNQRDIAALNEALTATNGKVANNESEIAGVKGEIGTINTKIATLEQKHNNQQTQINENATAINRLRHEKVSHCEFDKVAATVACNYRAINNLETQVTNNKVAVDNALAEMGTKVATLDKNVTDLSNDVNEIKAVVTPAKIAAMDEAIAENAKGIELVKGALNGTNSDVRRLVGKVHEHEVKIDTIIKEHAGMSAQIAQNKAGVEDNRGKIVANTAAIESLIATDNVHGTDIAALKVRVDSVDTNANQALAKATEIDEAHKTDMTQVKSVLRKHEDVLGQHESKITALVEKTKGIEARLEETQTIAEDVKAAMDVVKPMAEKNQSDIAELNKTAVTLNENMIKGFENINKNVADGFNTINGGIDNEIRPAITANTQKIAEHTVQIGDIQTRVDDVTTKATENGEALKNAVMYTSIADEQNPNRRTILLKNHDSISGLDTNGVGHNLVMVSKWNKADFGGPNIPFNTNGTEITFNDNDEIAHSPKA